MSWKKNAMQRNATQRNEIQRNTMERNATRCNGTQRSYNTDCKNTCLAVCAFKGRLTVAFIAICLVNTVSVVLARSAGAFIDVNFAFWACKSCRAATFVTITSLLASCAVHTGVWETGVVFLLAQIAAETCLANASEFLDFVQTGSTIKAWRSFAILGHERKWQN